jgi:hypothetical protein
MSPGAREDRRRNPQTYQFQVEVQYLFIFKEANIYARCRLLEQVAHILLGIESNTRVSVKWAM